LIEHYVWLIPLGLIIGAYGTLIGVGGGFVLVPLLLLLYPKENPEIITSISLAVVFFNALSGSVAYAWAKRIDYRSGIIFSASTIPGAILGALTTIYIPRRTFDLIFGFSLIGVSVFLLLIPLGNPEQGKTREDLQQISIPQGGSPYLFFNNRFLGMGLSFILGYFSSLLGTGAGFLYVPAFVYLLNFPVHIATATSQFILAIMALTGSTTHVVSGLFYRGVRRTLSLAIGVIIGAQLGARASNYVRGNWIIRSLAIGLLLVGVRLIVMAI